MVDWIYHYGENTIKVSLGFWGSHRLYVNGAFQDGIHTPPLPVTLRGKLNSGEELKVLIVQFSHTKILAKLYVDDKFLEPNTYYKAEPRNTQQTATNQVHIKEVTIIKEIVKIPCPYCHQLFDITTDKCPNCSAKNTHSMK
ncbi:MAG: hypothetical protein LBC03_05465 [Nitrososphaerota archaeon]|jgi:hypothetical protein|nr:hypothetical protein [Nitrososphaerota archaeon]